MAGTTDTQSLRFGQVDDIITHTMIANLADDIAVQLNAADTARTKALTRPQVQIVRNAALALPASAFTAVPFDSEIIDTHAMVDLVGQPQRVTCGATAGIGTYHVMAEANVDTTGWTRGDIVINKNGSFYDQRTFWGPLSLLNMETFVYFGAITDYVSISIYHEAGGTTNTNTVYLYVQKVCDN